MRSPTKDRVWRLESAIGGIWTIPRAGPSDPQRLMATANGDANVPAGYSQAYVLTSGTGLVIEQLGARPEFTVTTGGLYTIHSFVFPSDLDLSVVVPGVTTGLM